MRQFVLLLLVLFSLTARAQWVSFPLTAGDQWEWDNADITPDVPWKVTTDTLMPNGVSYKILMSLGYPAGHPTAYWYYLRYDSNRVYRYETYNNQEILFFDFDVAPDSVFSRFPSGTLGGQGSVKLLQKDLDILFNFPKMRWVFFYDPVNYVIDDEYRFEVTDSLGITGVHYKRIIGARIDGKTYGSLVSAVHNESQVAKDFLLVQPYPNPFNSVVSVQFICSTSLDLRLAVYDLLGREVSVIYDGDVNAGRHIFQWQANAMPSGVYFLVAGSQRSRQTRSVILDK